MVNKIDLLTDDEFTETVNGSSCISDVLRKLGYSTNGNSWGTLIVKERMEKLNLSFNKNAEHFSNNVNTAMPLDQIMVKDSGYNRTKLKARLLKEGIKEYKCEKCGLTEWLGQPISLQLHHINGIHNDHRLENLQLLCPNCHSQTDTFGWKGKGHAIIRKADNLSMEDIQTIMDKVREVGIVEARKRLSYRNSLINHVVKRYKDTIVMVDLDGNTRDFSTVTEAAMYLFNELHIGNSIESNRSGISKCCSGRYRNACGGYKFYRRSAGV